MTIIIYFIIVIIIVLVISILIENLHCQRCCSCFFLLAAGNNKLSPRRPRNTLLCGLLSSPLYISCMNYGSVTACQSSMAMNEFLLYFAYFSNYTIK